MSDFDKLLKDQIDLANKITNTHSNLKKVGRPKINIGAIESHMISLDARWLQFTENHKELDLLADEQQHKIKYFSENKYDEMEDIYIDERGKLIQEKHELTNPISLQVNQHVDPGSGGMYPIVTHRKMPPISLPKFDGKYTEWTGFKDLFKAISLSPGRKSRINMKIMPRSFTLTQTFCFR